MTKKIIIITGQTATGKTKLAFDYAQKYNGELINCDSRQIYQQLDIITGKDKQLVKKVKVWLYDKLKANKYFSSFSFEKLAIPIIKKILRQNKTPIMVGGTYLYLKHLLYNIDTSNIPPDWNLRQKLRKKSVKELLAILAKYSTQLIKQLSRSEQNNPQRLIRKIEIVKNVSINQLIDTYSKRVLNKEKIILKEKLGIKNLQIMFIGLKFKDKENLRKTIAKRVGERLNQGAVEEVRQLVKKGYKSTDPGLRTIGYQQLIFYLKGIISKEEAINQWINKEVQYAKRQYTFMKKDKNIIWKNV